VRTEPAPRGRVWLYAIAFVMLLVAGWLQVKGNLNSNLRQVRWSIGLSVAAVVLAVASVVVPGRRRRSVPVAKAAAPDAVTGDGLGSQATTSTAAAEPASTDPTEPESAAAEPAAAGPMPEPADATKPESTEARDSPNTEPVETEPGESGERPPSAP
jgi:hypothetical protein